MYYRIDLTEESRANLLKLADYLEKNVKPEYFDMHHYMADKQGNRVNYPTEIPPCCTVACALGHGPAAGIDPTGYTFWREYCDEKLLAIKGGGTSWRAFDWCFASRWKLTDNTIAGAVARIRILLEHGIPRNYYEQMYGIEPLEY